MLRRRVIQRRRSLTGPYRAPRFAMLQGADRCSKKDRRAPPPRPTARVSSPPEDSWVDIVFGESPLPKGAALALPTSAEECEDGDVPHLKRAAWPARVAALLNLLDAAAPRTCAGIQKRLHSQWARRTTTAATDVPGVRTPPNRGG